jgi:hypothetical protein
MNLGDPRNAGNFLTSCGTVSFAGRTLLCGVNIVSVFIIV